MHSQLRIDNPCPMKVRSRSDGNFDCKSCKSVVYDFRGKTDEEIKAVFQQGMCGVFTENQLPGQRPMVWHRKWLFTGLALLAAVGFSVKPPQAQSTKTQSTYELGVDKHGAKICVKPKRGRQLVNAGKTEMSRTMKRRARKHKRWKKKNPGAERRWIGCPSF